MKLKKKLVVGIVVGFALFIAVTLSMTSMSLAANSQKYAQCPRCHKYIYSYGYSPNFKWTTDSATAGHYCSGCNSVVPAGEYHSFLYSSDKYYFICSSASCSNLSFNDRKYEVYYDNPVSEHYVTQVE